MEKKSLPGKIMVPPDEVSALYGTAVGTLGNWRSKKIGPKFYRVQRRKILYRLEDLEAFFTAHPVLTNSSFPRSTHEQEPVIS